MKCSFCGNECRMTIRDSYNRLFNCCKGCYENANRKKMTLWVSCIFKAKKKLDVDNG
jgi:hypothetical protein